MKYTPGTIDNLQVIRRRQQRDQRRTTAALANEGTRPFQSIVKIQQQQADMQALLSVALNVVFASDSAEGFGISKTDTWVDVCSTQIRVPVNRSVGSFQATGSTVLTAKNAGVETGYVLRLLVDGRQVARVTADRESAESDVWEALCSGVLSLSGLKPGASIPIALQAYAVDAAVWPETESNTASLNVQAAFPASAAQQVMNRPTVALSAMKEE